MENQSNKENNLLNNEETLPKLDGNNAEKALKTGSRLAYFDYMPKYSNHGRHYTKGIGPDHEPSTIR